MLETGLSCAPKWWFAGKTFCSKDYFFFNMNLYQSRLSSLLCIDYSLIKRWVFGQDKGERNTFPLVYTCVLAWLRIIWLFCNWGLCCLKSQQVWWGQTQFVWSVSSLSSAASLTEWRSVLKLLMYFLQHCEILTVFEEKWVVSSGVSWHVQFSHVSKKKTLQVTTDRKTAQCISPMCRGFLHPALAIFKGQLYKSFHWNNKQILLRSDYNFSCSSLWKGGGLKVIN